MTTETNYVTAAQAAEAVKLNPATIRKFINRGLLKDAYRDMDSTYKPWMVNLDELKEYLNTKTDGRATRYKVKLEHTDAVLDSIVSSTKTLQKINDNFVYVEYVIGAGLAAVAIYIVLTAIYSFG